MTIRTTTTILLFILSGVYVHYYGKNIVKLNRWLVISWLIEGFLRVLQSVLYETEANIKVVDVIYMVYWVLSEINHLIFFLTVFRLKAIAIYTDLKNDSAEKIMKQLKTHRNIRQCFILMRALITFFQLWTYTKPVTAVSSDWYVSLNLTFSMVALVIMMCMQVYVLSNILQMQTQFRRYGHIKTHYGELLTVIIYIVHFGYCLFWFVVEPIILYKVNVGNFECSSGIQTSYANIRYWAIIGWPLSYQVAFFAIIY